MLEVITLFTINKIFENAECKLSAYSQMLYINCLIHYFKDKTPKVSSATAFEINKADFNSYDKYKKNLEQLNEAGLITIGENSIVFNNVWGQYIDRDKLEKVSPYEYVANFSYKPVKEFENELRGSVNIRELAKLKYKLNDNQIDRLIETFIKEQVTFEKTYPNFSECIKHCSYYIGQNIDKVQKETIKNNTKILGT
jgi:hypothetical protein